MADWQLYDIKTSSIDETFPLQDCSSNSAQLVSLGTNTDFSINPFLFGVHCDALRLFISRFPLFSDVACLLWLQIAFKCLIFKWIAGIELFSDFWNTANSIICIFLINLAKHLLCKLHIFFWGLLSLSFVWLLFHDYFQFSSIEADFIKRSFSMLVKILAKFSAETFNIFRNFCVFIYSRCHDYIFITHWW